MRVTVIDPSLGPAFRSELTSDTDNAIQGVTAWLPVPSAIIDGSYASEQIMSVGKKKGHGHAPWAPFG